MKKYLILLSAFVLTAFAISTADLTSIGKKAQKQNPQVLSIGNQIDTEPITLAVYLPDQEITKKISYTEGLTAFSVLNNVEELTLKTKQYDFGIFVEAINNFKSDSENSWIYYINGESGTTAADQALLHDGDFVEWKYEEVSYE